MKRNLVAESERHRQTHSRLAGERQRALKGKCLGSHPNGSLPSAPQMWCGEGETGGLEMEVRRSGLVVNHHHLCTGVDSRSRHKGVVPAVRWDRSTKFGSTSREGRVTGRDCKHTVHWLPMRRWHLDLLFHLLPLKSGICICFIFTWRSRTGYIYDAPLLHFWSLELELHTESNIFGFRGHVHKSD